MVIAKETNVFADINYPHLPDNINFAADELVAILHEKDSRVELLLPSLYGSLNNLENDIKDNAKDILIATDINHVLHVIRLLERYSAIAKLHPEYKLPWAAELSELFTMFTGHDDSTLETVIDVFL